MCDTGDCYIGSCRPGGLRRAETQPKIAPWWVSLWWRDCPKPTRPHLPRPPAVKAVKATKDMARNEQPTYRTNIFTPGEAITIFLATLIYNHSRSIPWQIRWSTMSGHGLRKRLQNLIQHGHGSRQWRSTLHHLPLKGEMAFSCRKLLSLNLNANE